MVTTMTMKIIRTYSELITLPTFEERFEYLRLDGRIGDQTFGFDRYLNQLFYKDKEWLSIRDEVIVRDQGCDLGIEEYELSKGQRILIHHMNPLTKEDIVRRTKFLLDPEYLITTCHRTHTAIHYGDENLLPSKPIIRTKNDTCPWRR